VNEEALTHVGKGGGGRCARNKHINKYFGQNVEFRDLLNKVACKLRLFIKELNAQSIKHLPLIIASKRQSDTRLTGLVTLLKMTTFFGIPCEVSSC
jgi:hypothetical protein